jgi:hypothetical protein
MAPMTTTLSQKEERRRLHKLLDRTVGYLKRHMPDYYGARGVLIDRCARALENEWDEGDWDYDEEYEAPLTSGAKTEYVVRWAEFEADDTIEPPPLDWEEFEEWHSHPTKPSTTIHSGTFKSKPFDSEGAARAYAANEVIERYPGDEIKWLAFCEIDKRMTETIGKLK